MRTVTIRSPSTPITTPAVAASPPSQAYSHQKSVIGRPPGRAPSGGPSRADPRDQLFDPRDELVLAVALELLPGREAPHVRHAVDEEDAVEVVDLVLEGAGGQPAPRLLV